MALPLDDKRLRRLIESFDRRRDIEYFYGPFLSAAIAGRDDAAMRLIMRAALDDGLKARMIDEIILQSHLFLGYPAMIEASRLFAGIHARRHKKNQLPGSYSMKDCREWNGEGMKKIKGIYGPAFNRLVKYINSFSPQILTWMINDGYGRVLSRRGASFHLRELSVIATLTVTSYTNQLGAHIRGALNVGAEPVMIALTMDNCRFFCSQAKIRTARKILSRSTAA